MSMATRMEAGEWFLGNEIIDFARSRPRRVAVLRMRNGTSKLPIRLPLGDSLGAPVRPAPGSRHHHGARPAARCRVSP